MGVALALGLYGRFAGLGLWSVGLDEYHSVMALRYILERGVPEFPGGGYYMRGLLPTYLAAAMSYVGGIDPTLAFRAVGVFSSFLAIPPLYRLAQVVGGANVARIVVGLFLLSTLEIETARYARMYSPFQALFLWQLWFLWRALREPDPTRAIRWMFALAAVGPFVFEGAIFLTVLLAFVPLCRARSFRARHVIAACALLVWTVGYESVDWRRLGGGPAAVVATESASTGVPMLGPLLLPNPSWAGLPNELVWIFLIPGVAIALLKFRQLALPRAWPPLLLVLAVLSVPLAFLHQFAAAVLVLAVAFFAAAAAGVERAEELIRSLWKPICAVTAAWLGIAVFFYASGGISRLGRRLYAEMVSYPDFLSGFVRPWFEQEPTTSVILGALVAAGGIAVLVNRGLRRRNSTYSLLLAVFGVFAAMVAVIGTLYQHSRYSLFLYPIWFILAVTPISWLHAWAKNRFGVGATVGAGVLLVAALFAADDFSLAHIASVSSYESAHRLTPASARQRERLDYQSVASFLDQLPAEATVIATERKISFYTDSIDLTYFSEDSPEFVGTTTDRGTREIWTNLPVISNPDELWSTVATAPAPVFAVYRGDAYRYPHAVEQALEERAGTVVFRSPDRSLLVKQLE